MTAGKTMDFFAHQDATRTATRRLVILFAFSVVCIVAVVCAVASVTLGSIGGSQAEIVTAAAAATLLVIAVGCMVRISQMRGGGAAVARMLGGREVIPTTSDDEERRLLNVVEEMAIASGLPVPRVFVLDHEEGINAFAAGTTTRDAAVAVTAGALRQFDRDELQGVIAHEFSHIFHGDMRLNTRLIGVLAGIVCLVTVGETLLRSMRHVRGRKNDGAIAFAILGISLMGIGSLGALFAGLIKAAVSRQREYLADASAVAYTRNPLGIGRALWRIGKSSATLAEPRAREASHMFFADGFSRWFGSLNATHPPIDQRIERVVPGYIAASRQGRGGSFLSADTPQARQPAPSATRARGGIGSVAGRRFVASAAAIQQIGQVDRAGVDAARDMISAIPQDLVAAARDPRRVATLAIALASHGAQDAGMEASEHQQDLSAMPHNLRLPLAALCAPAIASLEPAQRDALLEELREMAHADGKVTPFELALLCILQRHAESAGTRQASGRQLHLGALLSEIEIVLSWMAHQDQVDPSAAFSRSMDALVGIPPLRLRADGARIGPDAEPAVARLGRLAPTAKRSLLRALADVAAHDGKIAPGEGELLRALAACWDCPMPPLWDEADSS